MVEIKDLKDFVAGAVFTAMAVLFGWNAASIPIGDATQMGPGYFPFVLSLLLGGIGVTLMIRGVLGGREPSGPIAWQGLFLISLAAVLFAMLVRPAGFLPAVAIAAFAVTVANRKVSALRAAALTLGIVVSSWVIFIIALRLPWPVWGPWLTGS